MQESTKNAVTQVVSDDYVAAYQLAPSALITQIVCKYSKNKSHGNLEQQSINQSAEERLAPHRNTFLQVSVK